MITDNYFKVGKNEIFSFNGNHPDSAYVAAVLQSTVSSERISMWARPAKRGPWDNVDLIGHRAEHEILADIETAKDALLSTDMEDKFVAYWTGMLERFNYELEQRRAAAA